MPAWGLAALCLLAAPDDVRHERGEIFARDGGVERALFAFERTQSRGPSGSTVEVWFRDGAGAAALYEKVVYGRAGLEQYDSFQRQVDEHYSLRVAGGRGAFEVTRGGATRRSTEAWGPDAIIVDELPGYVRDHWAALLGGRTVPFRFAVMARAETVAFKMSLTRRTVREGQPVVAVRLRPRNPVFALFVAPVDMTFRDDSARALVEVVGPLPIKLRRGSGWADVSGRMVFAAMGRAPD